MTRNCRRANSLATLAISLSLSTSPALAFAPSSFNVRRPTSLHVIGEQASSIGPATLLRNLKQNLPQIPWLAEGDAPKSNKIDIPDHVAAVLSRPDAPKREAENAERTQRIRSRAAQASEDALKMRGMLVGEDDAKAWWRTQRVIPEGGREITEEDPLTVLVAGGGLAGLVVAAAAHAKGMKVIGLTGAKSSKLEQMSDICIKVPQTETYMIQELHLPVYHCLCLMLEDEFFGEN